MSYRYYSKKRPLMPGGYPTSKYYTIERIENFDDKQYVEEIDQEAWGFIESDKPIGYFDLLNYELTAVKTEKLFLQYAGHDSWSRYVYIAQNGKLWKFTDCCSPRECCEERGDVLYYSAGNVFDGEPDCPMGAHIEPIFVEDPAKLITLLLEYEKEEEKADSLNEEEKESSLTVMDTADNLIYSLIQNRKLFSGFAQDIINTWEQAESDHEKKSIEGMFLIFTGMEFRDYLKCCIREISEKKGYLILRDKGSIKKK